MRKDYFQDIGAAYKTIRRSILLMSRAHSFDIDTQGLLPLTPNKKGPGVVIGARRTTVHCLINRTVLAGYGYSRLGTLARLCGARGIWHVGRRVWSCARRGSCQEDNIKV